MIKYFNFSEILIDFQKSVFENVEKNECKMKKNVKWECKMILLLFQFGVPNFGCQSKFFMWVLFKRYFNPDIL